MPLGVVEIRDVLVHVHRLPLGVFLLFAQGVIFLEADGEEGICVSLLLCEIPVGWDARLEGIIRCGVPPLTMVRPIGWQQP